VTAPSPQHAPSRPAEQVIHLAPGTHQSGSSPPPSLATNHAGHHPADPRGGPHLRSWPLLILALPAAVAVWSGWAGIGQMTGFGQVHPLPGLWPAFHLNTAITLPIGVEAYAAYALRAWLTASATVSLRTRHFARRSAIGSLLLGMAGQIAYHLLAQAHTTHAPWAVTMAVSCLPVLVLGMGATLTHLPHADTHGPRPGIRTAVPGLVSRVTEDVHEGVVAGDDVVDSGRPRRCVLAGPWCVCWRRGGQSDVTSATAARALSSPTMALRPA
jgi:hypothetical protein